MHKRVSVRGLVEFILRSGSIDSRVVGINRMEEGSRIHRKLQKDAGDGYRTEVFLSITTNCRGISITVEGRADGIFEENGRVTVDEIKSTVTPLRLIYEDFAPVHWAQAKCYGHIYCAEHSLNEIDIRLTYYEMDTGEIKRFTRSFTVGELDAFFADLIDKYTVWAEFENEWHGVRTESAKAAAFPFDDYRPGQRRLAAATYRTIEGGARLFAVAPTGVGKTISTLFPAVKALGEGLCEKIFYLTAKTITRTAAEAAAERMRGRGLRVKSVTITAKDKICPLDIRACTPDMCRCADGHMDRVNDAIMDVLRSCDAITAPVILEYAERHTVCPFELSLDVSLWCDIIICDYNYLFDPQVYLKRFFSGGGRDYAFLIDEAHNLVDRSRDMFSAELRKPDFLAAKKHIGKEYKRLRSSLTKINAWLLAAMRECGESVTVRKERPDELVALADTFAAEFSAWLSENRSPDADLLDTFFSALTFLKIAELYDERYLTMLLPRGGSLAVKLFCADPSALLDECLNRGRAAVLFSATLTPVQYFMSVLGGAENAKALTVGSPFPRDNLLLLVAGNVSTRYRDRDGSIDSVADMISAVARGREGNYIAFFPSYSYMTAAYELFSRKHPDIEAVSQRGGMTETERDDFLARFEKQSGTFVAFCVLGGIFSEGIDLSGDRLIGAVIVGVGLPQINAELDIVRDYYGGAGYDFAYKFPGMNKVQQAAGRVIRSEADKGVALLIDDRFLSRGYQPLFPGHWHGFTAVKNAGEIVTALDSFWNGV